MKTNGAAEPQERGLDKDAARAEIDRLSKLDTLAYGQQRSESAQRIGITLSWLDKMVREARAADGQEEDDGGQGAALELTVREPYPKAVNGIELLDGISSAIKKYVVLSDDSVAAVALWIVASYQYSAFYIFPRLFITSPEKRCGKSTLFDVVECLVNKPLIASNATSSTLFRVIDKFRPTLLLDEADTFMRDNEDMRGVINSGHKRNGIAMRCVGDDSHVHTFSTFTPMAIASIGRQHGTIEDRSIIVTMRRRKPSEVVQSFRPDRAQDLELVASKVARFSADHRTAFACSDPVMPTRVFNRMADNFRPLLAVADVVGGKWPTVARRIAENMATAELGSDASLRVALLSDIKLVFKSRMLEKDDDYLFSADLVEALVQMEGRPWAELKNGKPMSQTGLARLLSTFPITSTDIRNGLKVAKGYYARHFRDAFERYLDPDEGVSSATPLQTAEIRQFPGGTQAQQSFECSGSNSPAKPQESAICSGVADQIATEEGEETAEWTD